MNITGIIAEYNPFHKGHQYHIEEARRLSNADAIIIVMSGSFVQRGTCAIADKYSRAQAALLCGADLVLELPALYAVSSAEFFAGGSIALLKEAGIVTHLAFGCENASLDSLQELASLLIEEPPAYKKALQTALSEGNSFPKARELAVRTVWKHPDAQALLSLPNNILGIEYCKQLKRLSCSILPVPVARLGGGYHQLDEDTLYSSASSIRQQLSSNQTNILSRQLPEPSLHALQSSLNRSFPLFDEDISSYVHHALLTVPGMDYTPYLDVSQELSNRISKHLFDYQSFHQFATLLKTKELTYSRICRCLIHILLNIKKDIYEPLRSQYAIPYLRILGMNKTGASLLRLIRKQTPVPLITNPAAYRTSLSEQGQSLLKLDCMATHIWNGAATDKFKQPIPNEYSQKLLKVSSAY